jgi:hypothetical protein
MKQIAGGVILLSLLAVTLGLSPLGSPLVQSSPMDIFEAARQGRLDRVQALLEADPEVVNARDGSSYTAMHWAAIRAQWGVFEHLARAGSDPNAVGGDGGTPLHWAAHHDRPDMVLLLLERGADVLLPNQWGRTPLHTAARRGCVRVAELLLDNGADPNAQTREGWTTLNVAYRSGHPDLVELLLSRGASEAIADQDGNLPRDVAFSRPTSISMTRQEKDEYVGEYATAGGFSFHVWRVGDQLHFLDFAVDAIDPVGEDVFFCRQEPWRVSFSRDGEGHVDGFEVDFLRQTVPTRKVFPSAGGQSYVGSERCRGCHSSGEHGGPYGVWSTQRHSRAFHTLTTDQAKGLAASREVYRDITDPSVEYRCLKCHIIGPLDPGATFADTFDRTEGVACEGCHGPGSAYIAPEIMTDREAFLANGGIIPDEFTCRTCHRDPGFQYLERIRRIAH